MEKSKPQPHPLYEQTKEHIKAYLQNLNNVPGSLSSKLSRTGKPRTGIKTRDLAGKLDQMGIKLYDQKGLEVPDEKRVRFVSSILSEFGSKSWVSEEGGRFIWTALILQPKPLTPPLIPPQSPGPKLPSDSELEAILRPIIEWHFNQTSVYPEGGMTADDPGHWEAILRDFRDACRKKNLEFSGYGERFLYNQIARECMSGRVIAWSRQSIKTGAGNPADREVVYRLDGLPYPFIPYTFVGGWEYAKIVCLELVNPNQFNRPKKDPNVQA